MWQQKVYLILYEFYILFVYKTHTYWRVLCLENSSGHIQQYVTSFSLSAITFESSCLHKLQVNKKISNQNLGSAETITSWAYRKCIFLGHFFWPNMIVLLLFFYRRILMAHSMWFHLKNFFTSLFLVSMHLSSVCVMLDKNCFICATCKTH